MTEHEAGRKLDGIVAEQVMGWKRWKFSSPDRSGNEAFTYDTLVPPEYDGSNLQDLNMIIPRYSTNIADAWLVVERMKANGWHYEIGDRHSDLADCVTFGRGDYDRYDNAYEYGFSECTETTPLAICLAALRAIEYTQESEAR